TNQFSFHDLSNFLMVILNIYSWTKNFWSCLMHPEYSVIHFSLPFGKAAVDRNGTRHVRIIIAVFCTHVQKKQVAVITRLIVLHIMKDTGTGTRGNNWFISKSPAPVHQEFMDKFRFNFILHHARLDKVQDSSEPFFCNITCHLHLVNFLLLFHRAQLMHNGSSTVILVKRISFLTLFDKPGVPAFHPHFRSEVLVGIEKYMVAQGCQRVKHAFKTLHPLDVLDS